MARHHTHSNVGYGLHQLLLGKCLEAFVDNCLVKLSFRLDVFHPYAYKLLGLPCEMQRTMVASSERPLLLQYVMRTVETLYQTSRNSQLKLLLGNRTV